MIITLPIPQALAEAARLATYAGAKRGAYAQAMPVDGDAPVLQSMLADLLTRLQAELSGVGALLLPPMADGSRPLAVYPQVDLSQSQQALAALLRTYLAQGLAARWLEMACRDKCADYARTAAERSSRALADASAILYTLPTNFTVNYGQAFPL